MADRLKVLQDRYKAKNFDRLMTHQEERELLWLQHEEIERLRKKNRLLKSQRDEARKVARWLGRHNLRVMWEHAAKKYPWFH